MIVKEMISVINVEISFENAHKNANAKQLVYCSL